MRGDRMNLSRIGMSGMEMRQTQVPWPQVTQDDLTFLQNQARGGGGSAGGM